MLQKYDTEQRLLFPNVAGRGKGKGRSVSRIKERGDITGAFSITVAAFQAIVGLNQDSP